MLFHENIMLLQEKTLLFQQISDKYHTILLGKISYEINML